MKEKLWLFFTATQFSVQQNKVVGCVYTIGSSQLGWSVCNFQLCLVDCPAHMDVCLFLVMSYINYISAHICMFLFGNTHTHTQPLYYPCVCTRVVQGKIVQVTWNFMIFRVVLPLFGLQLWPVAAAAYITTCLICFKLELKISSAFRHWQLGLQAIIITLQLSSPPPPPLLLIQRHKCRIQGKTQFLTYF